MFTLVINDSVFDMIYTNITFANDNISNMLFPPAKQLSPTLEANDNANGINKKLWPDS